MKHLLFLALISIASAQLSDDFDITEYNETDLEIKTIEFEGEEPGSGGGERVPACEMNYVMYEKKYLRGVKGAYHVSFNETSFEECARLCCYENKFECQSFSYMEILKQCFIMNVTQKDPKFELVDALGHIHVQLVEIPDVTTAPYFKMPPFPTPAPWKPQPPPGNSILCQGGCENGKCAIRRGSDGISESYCLCAKGFEGVNCQKQSAISSGSIQKPNLCQENCENGGKCELRRASDDVYEAYCECTEGFEGPTCEKQIANAAAFPLWLIAVIAVAAILLIILIVACVLCHKQKKKTGEYRVFSALRDWARRARKPKKAISSEDFFAGDAPYNSPKNPASIYDTMGSITHSTSTPV